MRATRRPFGTYASTRPSLVQILLSRNIVLGSSYGCHRLTLDGCAKIITSFATVSALQENKKKTHFARRAHGVNFALNKFSRNASWTLLVRASFGERSRCKQRDLLMYSTRTQHTQTERFCPMGASTGPDSCQIESMSVFLRPLAQFSRTINFCASRENEVRKINIIISQSRTFSLKVDDGSVSFGRASSMQRIRQRDFASCVVGRPTHTTHTARIRIHSICETGCKVNSIRLITAHIWSSMRYIKLDGRVRLVNNKVIPNQMRCMRSY